MPEYDVPFILQYGGLSYEAISATNSPLFIVEPSDVNLTTAQLAELEDDGKQVIAYLSIGEAEERTDFWNRYGITADAPYIFEQSGWESENITWRVDFTNSAWQNMLLTEAVLLAEQGYDGLFLDIVDIYQNLYPGGTDAYWVDYDLTPQPQAIIDTQREMIEFVTAISEATKAINPDFNIIPNNAMELLVYPEYVEVVDATLAEKTFYSEEGVAMNTEWEGARWLDIAVNAGIPVFTIDYVLGHGAEIVNDYFSSATDRGYIPMAANRDMALQDFPDVNFSYYAEHPLDYAATNLDTLLPEEEESLQAAGVIVASLNGLNPDDAREATDFPDDRAIGSGNSIIPG